MTIRALALVLSMLALVGCAQAGVPSPDARSSGAVPAGASCDGCLVLDVDSDPPMGTLENLRRDSTAVVVGTFLGFEEAHWSTPDRRRPTATEFATDTARLVRVVDLHDPRVFSGNLGAAGRAVWRGGESGCDRVTYNGDGTLDAGQRYVLFLVPLLDSKGKESADNLIMDAWHIDDGDIVSTRQDGALSLDALADALVHGLEPTQTPVEPE